MTRTPRTLLLTTTVALASAIISTSATALTLPASASPQFCIAVQQALASTTQVGENTVFDDMPSYRHSKPSIKPLRLYQVVTYAGPMPTVVSCKMKTAAHLRAIYGAKAAGDQLFCPDIARLLQQQAADELRSENNADAAVRVMAFMIDRDAPFITGQAYLEDFRTVYRADNGAIHVSSPGLYQNYDSWITTFLPEFLKGQSYCHLATVESLNSTSIFGNTVN